MRDLTAVDFDWKDDTSAGFEAASVVDRNSSFEGTFRSQKDLRVEGELKGTIACDGTLFVAEGAVVSATIDAEHVTVAGDVIGEVRCRGRLHILPSGRVRARVATGSLVIQEGAIYEGELDMAGMERAAPRPLRTRSAPPPVSIETAAADRQGSTASTFIRRLGSPETAWESTDEDSPEYAKPAESSET
jgi:cytoskeletal protein CcmA (bactofilin family)